MNAQTEAEALAQGLAAEWLARNTPPGGNPKDLSRVLMVEPTPSDLGEIHRGQLAQRGIHVMDPRKFLGEEEYRSLLAATNPNAIPGYAWTRDGALMALNFHPRVYDPSYVAERYDVYGEAAGRRMSALRVALMRAHIGTGTADGDRAGEDRGHMRALDFGLGNGAFLKQLRDSWGRVQCWGYDISQYRIDGIPMWPSATDGVEWDVITFWDSLEHVEDIDRLVAGLNTRFVVISLPWCHARTMGADWFMGWKHRRPDEHKWHFDPTSLSNFMHRHGYRTLFVGNPEDVVRTPGSHLPNILTGVFQKL